MDMKEKVKKISLEKYGPLFALIVLFVISSIASPYFLKIRNLTNILRQISYTGIIALGMTFVITSGGIDLSVGSMTAFVGGLSIITLNYFGGGYLALIFTIIFGIIYGFLAGAFNGLVITKGKVAPFIVTLGTMAIYRSVILYIADAGELTTESTVFSKIGMGYFLGIPIPVWVFVELAFVFHIILNHTPYGRYLSAVGSNERVAKYAAIRVKLIRFWAYALTGIGVAISSILLAARLNSVSSANMGLRFELDAIAAVIIGGTAMSGGKGTIIGTVIGAIILGIVNNMLNMLGVSPYLQGTVKGLVIIGAVLIQRKSD